MSRRAALLVRAVAVLALVAATTAAPAPAGAEHTEGEEPPPVWIHEYQRGGIHDATAVPGGYVLVGRERRYAGGDHADLAWAAKIDHAGDVVWRRTFNGTDAGVLYGVDRSPDGGAIAVGKRNAGSLLNDGRMWVVRLEPDGSVAWNETYGAGVLADVAATPDGGGLAVGQSWEPFPEGFGVRIDGDGSEAWRRTFGGERLDAVIHDRSGAGFLLAGTGEREHGSVEGANAIALWPGGDVRWRRFYGNGTSGARTIRTRPDGVVLAGGRTVIHADHRGRARNVTRVDAVEGGIRDYLALPGGARLLGLAAGRSQGALARLDGAWRLERRIGSKNDHPVGRVEALVPAGEGRYLAVGTSEPIYDSGFAYLTDQVPPRAALSADPSVAETGETRVALDAGASGDNTAVRYYRWDFDGNGSVDDQSTASNATHVYGRLGRVDATVTAVDVDGNRANATASVVLEDTTPPVPGLSAPAPRFVASTAPARLDAGASTDNHRVVEYRWDFDGDGAVDAVTDAPRTRHRFAGGGPQFVELTVVDAVGHAATRTFVLETVPNDGPPNVTVRGSFAVVGDPTYFEANATDRVGTPTVRWTFPNGSTASGSTASYTFERAGTRNVTVVVEDEYGARRRVNHTVDVRSHYPPDDAGGVGYGLGLALLVYGAVGLFLLAVLAVAVLLGLAAVVRWIRGGDG